MDFAVGVGEDCLGTGGSDVRANEVGHSLVLSWFSYELFEGFNALVNS